MASFDVRLISAHSVPVGDIIHWNSKRIKSAIRYISSAQHSCQLVLFVLENRLGRHHVHDADFLRVRRTIDSVLCLGQSLLPIAVSQRKVVQHRQTSVGLQMDSDHLPLLENQNALRRTGSFEKAGRTRFSLDSQNVGISATDQDDLTNPIPDEMRSGKCVGNSFPFSQSKNQKTNPTY